GGGVVYGVSDEESRLNLNTATADELAKLQNMTPDVAAAIVNWRGGDSATVAAEAQYYAGLQPPYQPRNGPFQTVRELLMVRGVTADLFLSRDVHQNGLLAAAGEHDFAFPGSVDSADLVWAGILTVDSTVQNLNAAGEDRVNIQSADESSLTAIRGITPQIARAVVAWPGRIGTIHIGSIGKKSGGRKSFHGHRGRRDDGNRREPVRRNQHQHRRPRCACLSAGREPRTGAGHHFAAAVGRIFCQHGRAVKSPGIDERYVQANCSAGDRALGNFPHFERRENQFIWRTAAHSGHHSRRTQRPENTLMAGGRPVKKISFLNPPPLYVEIGQSRLKALHENSGVELALERQPDGRLTAPCKEKTVAAFKDFLKAKGWQPRARAFCAIGSRGVSLRRLSLPAGVKEEFHQRLLLQIAGEFSLPPDELAWGCQQLGGSKLNGAMAKQELLVAAVKKAVVADYREILRACGTEPVFTLAALARRNLCAESLHDFAMLDIGNSQSELAVFEKGVPTNSRIVFWGGENTSSLAEAKLDTLAQAIKGSLTGTKLFVSGSKISEDFATRLDKALGTGWQCERLEATPGEGRSAAIAGLKTIDRK